MPVTAPSVGDPTKQSFAQDVVDSITDIEATYNTVLSLGFVTNGSFEEDSDADNVPDGWTFTAQTAGTGVLDATTSCHGIKSFKITSLGSGNGGGSLQMNSFAECSPNVPLLFAWQSKSSVAGVKNLFEVRWYTDADESDFISTSTLWSEDTNNPTSGFLHFSAGVQPPATARYFKIKITGCDSSDTTAGSAWFDGVTVSPSHITATFSDSKAPGTAGGTSTGTTWTKHDLQTESDPFGIGSLASSVITMLPGRYSVTIYGVAYRSDAFQYRLRNTTDSSTAVLSLSGYSISSANNAGGFVVGFGEVDITKTTNFELQYYVDTGFATSGLGQASPGASGENGIFASVTFVKLG